jgi:hypothetical protein
MNKSTIFISAVSLLISAPVLAHSGHDHNAANSGLIHLLWLAPAIVAVGIMSYRKIIAKSDNK